MGGYECTIKGHLNVLCIQKETNLNEEEKKLNTKIEHLEKGLGENISNNEWIRELMEYKEKLENIREHKFKGALIRSRWQLSSMGEKPSKFFFNLENIFFISKHIRELKNGNNTILNPQFF